MNDPVLIFLSLKARALSNLLSVFLIAFGFMLSLLVLMFGNHIQKRLGADGQGIDLVIGAKGNPLQLILSSIYHVDLPTGNISYREAQRWINHPQIKRSVPLALGDNWHGYRIVGTTAEYLTLYGASLREGKVWQHPFEAVAGADTGLSIGQEFSGAHGLLEGGHVHEDEHYRIVGTLKPTGTVLDRLILASVESVLDLHGQHHHEEPEDEPDEVGHEEHQHHEEHDGHGESEKGTEPEITAVLLTVKSPIALMNLPHTINRESSLQAANPALEMARLTSMLGLGSQTLSAFSFLLIAIASLSIFTGLAGSLENRSGDLAVLRALGYSKRRVTGLILAEGLLLTFFGLILGFILGIAAFHHLASVSKALSESRAVFDFSAPGLAAVILSIFIAGLISAMVPGWKAGHIDISQQLSKTA